MLATLRLALNRNLLAMVKEKKMKLQLLVQMQMLRTRRKNKLLLQMVVTQKLKKLPLRVQEKLKKKELKLPRLVLKKNQQKLKEQENRKKKILSQVVNKLQKNLKLLPLHLRVVLTKNLPDLLPQEVLPPPKLRPSSQRQMIRTKRLKIKNPMLLPRHPKLKKMKRPLHLPHLPIKLALLLRARPLVNLLNQKKLKQIPPLKNLDLHPLLSRKMDKLLQQTTKLLKPKEKDLCSMQLLL